MNPLLKSAFIFLFFIIGIGVSAQNDDQPNNNIHVKSRDVKQQLKFNLTDQNTNKVRGFISFKKKPKSIFDASYQRYLKAPTKNNRFNLNLVNMRPYDNIYKGGNNLTMVRNGQSPYYANGNNQPTFVGELLLGVAQNFFSNMRIR